MAMGDSREASRKELPAWMSQMMRRREKVKK